MARPTYAERSERISLISKILRGGHSFLGTIEPKEECHKCHNEMWMRDLEPYTWYCPICGNRVYFTYGTLRQQIDIVLLSQRGHDFVVSESGCIVPRRNDEISHIKVNQAIEEKKANKKMRRAQKREEREAEEAASSSEV